MGAGILMDAVPKCWVDSLCRGIGNSAGGALGEFQVSGPRGDRLDDSVEPGGTGRTKRTSCPDGAQVVECAVNG